MKYTITMLIVASVLLITPASTVGQEMAPIFDLNDNPARYLNRELAINGQVLEVQADPEGTVRGWYRIVDESDPDGILVRSQSLPAPGVLVEVRGQIRQDARNAGRPYFAEAERCEGSCTTLLPWIVGGSAVASIALLGLLVGSFRSRGPSGPRARGAGMYGAPSGYDGETMDYSPPSGSAGREKDVTQEYHNWGATLEVLEGPDAGRRVPVGVSPFFIGRSGGRSNNLTLSDPTVSRSHAKIVHNDSAGTFSIVNESGRNPVELDDRQVDAAELSEGNRIRVGSTLIAFRTNGSAF